MTFTRLDAARSPSVTPFLGRVPPEELKLEAVFVRPEVKIQSTQAQQRAWDKLPPRQKEAATLIASGMSTRQVAAKMHIQISTLQGYLKETYAALNVRSRTELANFVRDISLENSYPHTI